MENESSVRFTNDGLAISWLKTSSESSCSWISSGLHSSSRAWAAAGTFGSSASPLAAKEWCKTEIVERSRHPTKDMTNPFGSGLSPPCSDPSVLTSATFSGAASMTVTHITYAAGTISQRGSA